MAHPLRVYLDKHGITEPEFAESLKAILGINGDPSANYISQIIGGFRKPGGEMAVAISDATNKSVSVDDLMRFRRVPPPKRRKRAA